MTRVVPGSSTEYRINTLCKAAKALVRSSNEEDDMNEYSKCTTLNDFSIIIKKIIKMHSASPKKQHGGVKVVPSLGWPWKSQESSWKHGTEMVWRIQWSQRCLPVHTLLGPMHASADASKVDRHRGRVSSPPACSLERKHGKNRHPFAKTKVSVAILRFVVSVQIKLYFPILQEGELM